MVETRRRNNSGGKKKQLDDSEEVPMTKAQVTGRSCSVSSESDGHALPLDVESLRETEYIKSNPKLIRQRRTYLLGGVIVFILFLIVYSYKQTVSQTHTTPEVAEPDEVRLSLPTSLVELKQQRDIILRYKEEHPALVLGLFALLYMFKQSFAVPGSVFLNVFAGAIFGLWVAFPMVCILTTIGASCCYGWSKILGVRLVRRLAPDKLNSFAQMVENHRHNLMNYLICLRIFPFTPNWFLNMASPIVGIPYRIFAVSLCIGLMPYNFLCVKAGESLSQLQSTSDTLDMSAILSLVGIAFLALIPAFMKKTRVGAEATIPDTSAEA